MYNQIEHYLTVLQQAADASVGYNEPTHILDGASPADFQDVIVDLLADEVKAGRVTQDESNDIQINRLPY